MFILSRLTGVERVAIAHPPSLKCFPLTDGQQLIPIFIFLQINDNMHTASSFVFMARWSSTRFFPGRFQKKGKINNLLGFFPWT